MKNNDSEIKVWSGEFWVEGASELPLHGELRYQPSKWVELNVAGTSKRPVTLSTKYREFEFLTGKLGGVTPVTLIESFENYVEGSLGSAFKSCQIIANLAVIGANLQDRSTPSFKELWWKSPSLKGWHDQDIFNVDQNTQEHEKITVNILPPQITSIPIDDLRTFEIRSNSTIPNRHSNGILQIEKSVSVAIKYERYVGWDQVASDENALDALFVLMFGQLCGPPEITLVCSETSDLREQKRKLSTASVLKCRSWYSEPTQARRNVSLPFSSASTNLEKIVRTWFDLYPRFQNIFTAYTTALEHGQYLERKFLLLTQAVEGLHRETHGGTLISPELFKEIESTLVKALPDNLPKETRDILAQRIGFMNESGFQRRIKETCRALPYNAQKLFADPKTDSFQINAARNQLVHVGGKSDSSLDQRLKKFDYFNEFLRTLFELRTFKALGLSDDAFQMVINSNYRYSGLPEFRRTAYLDNG